MSHVLEVVYKSIQRSNPFYWSNIKKSLPGNKDNHPYISRLFSIYFNGHVAREIICYLDDYKRSGDSEIECWEILERVGKWLFYLGIQVASRKRRKVVSQTKVDKIQSHIFWLTDELEKVGGGGRDMGRTDLIISRVYSVISRVYVIISRVYLIISRQAWVESEMRCGYI